MVNDFLELKTDEVAVYLTDLQEGKTIIKRLTDDETDHYCKVFKRKSI